MKVFELMSLLKNAPAGMDVRIISNEQENCQFGNLIGVEIDGNEADSGFCTLTFNNEADDD